MNKFSLLVIALFFNSSLYSTDFITRWDMNKLGGSSTSIAFEVGTTGTVNYTWETVPAGSSGAGVFSGSTATISNLPANAIIRLHIDPTNFNRININNIVDKQRLVDVEQWGSVVWSSMETAFFGCSSLNITSTDIPNLNLVSSMYRMFNSCSILNGPANINSWNTSNVTDMREMFQYDTTFNQPIGNWNTSNVTHMNSMFEFATHFNQPIGGWNTSNVVSMFHMFKFCLYFNQPIGNWDVSNVTDMHELFNNAQNFNQPIGNWNTSNVIGMTNMFFRAYDFNQPIGNWNTGNVTNMGGMFQYASSFNQPIGNWNTSNVVGMASMFSFTPFNQPLNNWNTSNVYTMSGMFWSTPFNQPLNNWNTSNVVNMYNMFYNASSFNQSLGNWMLDSNTLIWGMLDSCGMNCENYSSTIAGWSSSPTCPSGLQLGANSLHYGSNVQTYRDNLINTKGWMIFGDSMNVIPCCFTLFNTLNVNTCNSYFFNGQTLTSSGVYYDTLSNAYGCDSLITLNLTINNVSQSVINQTACNSYFFNGQTLTSSGTYYDTLLNANGCDSLITLNLTINNVNILISQAGPNLNANATGATYQWLTCPSYSPIIGDNMQNFIASTNGDYAVEVTVNGCTDTSACYTVIGIGIQEINNASSFSVYPNPVSNTLYIQSSTAFTDKKKEFYNAFGQILFTTKNNVIDVSTYSKGIYYLKCEHQVVKVVVE